MNNTQKAIGLLVFGLTLWTSRITGFLLIIASLIVYVTAPDPSGVGIMFIGGIVLIIIPAIIIRVIKYKIGKNQ